MKRDSGVLLSITSLPSKYGIGCFSKSAYDFVDWLAAAGQKYWQILPLGATSHGSGDSPYQAYSAFAGNPYFISLEELIKEGVLTKKECDAVDFGSDPTRVDYDKLHAGRLPLLRKAYKATNLEEDEGYQTFVKENAWWLDDYALFMAAKAFFQDQSWTQWPEDLRMHWDFALEYYNEKLSEDVGFHKYLQYKFCQQWFALKAYANARHIQIVGDIPIYVSMDSSDVWAHPDLFQLDEKNAPSQVAGCPPDSFSEDGQHWGNPLYRWDRHRDTGFDWWCSRMWYSFKLYDVVRIDHFRGFDEYFAIPAGKTPKDGHWEKGPGIDLFHTIRYRQGGDCRVIAEDLGFMTDTVRQLVKDSGFPNMKVIQFAFDIPDEGGANEYTPHNYDTNCVVYTGTHDNETTSGWFTGLPKKQKAHIRTYLNQFQVPDEEMYKEMNRLALMCAAKTCIIPIQDWLGLGNDCRMNQPGTVGTNWSWRLAPRQITKKLAAEMLTLAKRYGRANWDSIHTLTEKEEKVVANPQIEG